MTMRARRFRPFSFIFIGAILLSITVIAVVLAAINQNLYNEARINDLISEKEKEIIGSASYVQSTLSLISNISTEVAYDWDVISYCNNKEENFDVRREIITHLRNSANSHVYIQSMALVYFDRNEVLTSHEGWFDTNSFYDSSILDENLLRTHAESGEAIVNRSFKNRSGEHVEVVTFVNKLFTMDNHDNNYLVTNIRVDKLLQAMDVEKWKHSNSILLMDGDGELVLDNSSGKLSQILSEVTHEALNPGEYQSVRLHYEGEDSILIRWMSDYNNWIYTSVCSVESGFIPLNYLRNTSLILLVIAIICILVLLYALAFKIYKPIRKITNKIQKAQVLVEREDVMDFGYIEQTLDNILNANTIMQNAYLESILIGGRKHTEVSMFGQWMPSNYRTLLFSPLYDVGIDNTTIQTEHHQLQNAMISCMKAHGVYRENNYRFIPLMGYELFMIIMTENNSTGTALNTIVQEALQQHNSQSEYRWNAAISGLHPQIDTLHVSYQECYDAMDFRYFDAEQPVFEYDSLKSVPRHSYFPDGIKMSMLSNNLLSMNYEGAQNIIHDVIDDVQHGSKEMFFHNIPSVFSQFRDMIMKSIHSNGIPTTPLFDNEEGSGIRGKTHQTLKSELKAVDSLLEHTREYVGERYEGAAKPNFGSKILEYVTRNYQKDISLTTMSVAFGMTESYLSTRFKEIFGVSFVKYVTKLRIDRTKQLLQERPDMKISEIAAELSLGNAQNLIRVFKKYEGITPGQYREKYQKEEFEGEPTEE